MASSVARRSGRRQYPPVVDRPEALPLVDRPTALPCVTCHASCCRLTLPITALDAVRMHRDLGRPIAEFTALSAHDPDRVGFRLRPDGERHRLVLARQAQGALAGWCSFFDPAHPGGGCTVYGARPMPCRMYPATLRFGEVVLREPNRCPSGAWTPGTALWGSSWRRTAERTVAEQVIDFGVNIAWNRAMSVQAPDAQTADTVAAGTPAKAPVDIVQRYLDWVTEVYLAIDHRTGCLDRTAPLSPDVVTAVKAMLRQ